MIVVNDSTRQSCGYDNVVDYYMSEKFGLDWKEYDHSRMRLFIEIMNLRAERTNRENDKSSKR